MASKNTQLKAKNTQGEELQVSHSQSDSPILDVHGLERLQQFRPDIVDFVIEQTRQEAESRRKKEEKILWFTFIERVFGILLGFAVCAFGVYGSISAANQGHNTLAITIATISIGTLAVAFIKRQ